MVEYETCINRNYENDYIFGENEENIILPILINYFKDNELKLTDRYDKFDIRSNKYNIEIKSRKFNHDKYFTTLIPSNKCIIEDNKETIFIINFVDRIYYIKYEPELFNKFQKTQFSRQNKKEYDLPYYFINLTYLKLLQIK
jgi:hypothetical protein